MNVKVRNLHSHKIMVSSSVSGDVDMFIIRYENIDTGVTDTQEYIQNFRKASLHEYQHYLKVR